MADATPLEYSEGRLKYDIPSSTRGNDTCEQLETDMVSNARPATIPSNSPRRPEVRRKVGTRHFAAVGKRQTQAILADYKALAGNKRLTN